jgi:hypothetical protein
MPLPKAAPRKLLHTREIRLHGYQRDDGLFDIDCHMTDIKPYSFANQDRDGVAAGEPMHDMWLRVTFNREMMITAVAAEMDSTPFSICPGVAPNYQRLIGLTIGKGFLKTALGLLVGTAGCTHLRELLQPIATVAFQTMFSVRNPEFKSKTPGVPAFLLNSCHGYAEDGPVVARAMASGK